MPRAKKTPAAEPAPVTVVAYKGFDKNLQCRGYQFEVGKTFDHAGPVEACSRGFHACENPMDVLGYYGVGDGNRFARVTLAGELSRHGEDSKIAAGRITLDAELRLPDFISAAVKWMMANTAKGAKGERVQVASGDYSQLATSGRSSKLAASGHYSKLATSGRSSKLAASGDSSQLATSGHYSKLAASGHYSKLATSGHYSKLAASGDSSQLEITGAKSAAAAVGHGSLVKAIDGTPIAICEWANGKPVGFATGIVGQDGIRAGVWYRAEAGKLVTA